MSKIKWLDDPKEANYPAALSYLSLIYPYPEAYVDQLKEADVIKYKAKDVFRASGLHQLGPENYHVKHNLEKIESGAKISPILLVRDTEHGKVIIADGYHRMCAIHHYDEDADIHCKIV